jgi:hypothetical protein
MNTKYLKIIIVFLLITNLATIAFVFLGHKRRHHKPFERELVHTIHRFISKELALDTNQAKLFDEYKKSFKESKCEKFESMKDNQLQMVKVLLENPSDTLALSKIKGEAFKIHNELVSDQEVRLLNLFKILNPDQKAKLKVFLTEFKSESFCKK